jgi:hypothetical protein
MMVNSGFSTPLFQRAFAGAVIISMHFAGRATSSRFGNKTSGVESIHSSEVSFFLIQQCVIFLQVP